MTALSIILIGFTAMASQIIYMRELLTVFYGNELSISFIMAGWLAAGAIGSAGLSRFTDGIKDKAVALRSCQVALGVLIPLGIFAARVVKPLLNINPGEAIPLFNIMALSFIILAPICIILGFMFSLACSTTSLLSRPGLSGTGKVYVLEAAGSLIGGALTGVIFVRFFGALYVAAILSALNFAAALAPKISARRTALYLLAAVIALWYFGGLRAMDNYSFKKQWSGYNLVASKDSIYGNIAVTKNREDYSFFDNGLHLYTVPDRLNSEEAVHLALLEHPSPKDVLLIGAGIGGLVEEALKEPVKSIDYIELDPLIIKMARDYLPESYYKALKDDRVSIKNTDGRYFIKTTENRYDCILIDIGDPYTAQINRYYTAEFFNEARRILKKGGLLSFSLSYSESYVGPALEDLLGSVYFTLKGSFDKCMVLPGNRAIFVASDDGGYFTSDSDTLEKRIAMRSLDTKYVSKNYLFSNLSPEKVSYINKVIPGAKGARTNHDLNPSSYYYGLIYWATLFRGSALSVILKAVNGRVIWQAIGVFLLIVILLLALFKRSFKNTALAALASGGFSTMAFQLLIMLAFQAKFGYLFYKLGMILTAFMAGLAIGAIFAMNAMNRLGRERTFLAAVQSDLVLYAVVLPVFLQASLPEAVYPVLSVIAGFIGGAQFPLVNNVLLKKNAAPGQAGGLSYGTDLAGSVLGAILTGVVLVPVLGIVKSCAAIAVINAAMLALLAFNLRIEE